MRCDGTIWVRVGEECGWAKLNVKSMYSSWGSVSGDVDKVGVDDASK